MLANSTGRTLNLLDEYGKGTAESNGMALLAGVLRSILKRPLSGAPLTFCTTHFVEILKEPLLPLSSTRLGFFSMEVMMGEITADPRLERPSTRLKTGSRLTSSMTAKGSETVGRNAESHESDAPIALFQSAVRTYRLRLGSICDESRALQCALEAGVPKDILERAAHIIAMISAKGKIENVVACERNNPRIKLCADMVRKFIADDSNMMNFVNDDESSALLEQVIAEEEEITGE